MCNNPEDADLPRRIRNRRGRAVPAASAASAASTAADGELSGWIDGPARHGLPGSAASASATATGASLGRTRIITKGKRPA